MSKQMFRSKYESDMIELTIQGVVKRTTDDKYRDRQIAGMNLVLMHMASVLSDGQQVRLAELLRHVPVVVPFKPTESCRHDVSYMDICEECAKT